MSLNKSDIFMIRYKDFKLIQPDSSQSIQIKNIIGEQGGSVFQELFLNKLASTNFNSRLFYLVDDINHISTFAPIHQFKGKNGLNRYLFRPFFDIPYAGFLGEKKVDMSKLKVGFFESYKYEEFPYYSLNASEEDNLQNGLTAILNLSPSIDEIFETEIHSKKRNMIRKALKEGVTIRKYSEEKGMHLLWSILEPMHEKLGFDSRMNFDYYNAIFEYYAKHNQAFILIAFKDDQPVSGVFILGNKNYMHYYKGASIFGSKNFGQNELLQFEAIKHSKLLNAKYYDLCNLNKNTLPGIYKFKTGICNHLVEYRKGGKNRIGFQLINRIKEF